jgi:hypothetical protein
MRCKTLKAEELSNGAPKTSSPQMVKKKCNCGQGEAELGKSSQSLLMANFYLKRSRGLEVKGRSKLNGPVLAGGVLWARVRDFGLMNKTKETVNLPKS